MSVGQRGRAMSEYTQTSPSPSSSEEGRNNEYYFLCLNQNNFPRVSIKVLAPN